MTPDHKEILLLIVKTLLEDIKKDKKRTIDRVVMKQRVECVLGMVMNYLNKENAK